MGERKKQQEGGPGEQGVPPLTRVKPKYSYTVDYIHEQFHNLEQDGTCEIRCPFGYLEEKTIGYLGMYRIKMLTQDERGTVYKVTLK